MSNSVLVFESVADPRYEDSLHSLSLRVSHDDSNEYFPDKSHFDDMDQHLFIDIKSWNQFGSDHKQLEPLINKRLRISIEVL